MKYVGNSTDALSTSLMKLRQSIFIMKKSNAGALPNYATKGRARASKYDIPNTVLHTMTVVGDWGLLQ